MIERLSFNIAVDITGMLGMFLMLFSLVDSNSRQNPKVRYLISMFLIMISMLASDFTACIYRGRPHALLILYAANTANYMLTYILFYAFVEYMALYLGLNTRGWNIFHAVLQTLSTVMIILTTLNPLHKFFFVISPETGVFQRRPAYVIHTLYLCSCLIIMMVMILLKKGLSLPKRAASICCFFNPLLMGAIQQFYPGISLSNLGCLLSALMVYSTHYAAQNLEAERTSLELENTRSALVLSQIQPHFLFNSMASIIYLCDTDPQEAKIALQELSDYLHFKISALSHSYVVPLTEDLDYLQNYVKLEKRRYGPRLTVEFDLECTDFQIPLLTLQPLVENAIRHGISKRPKGGTIRISSQQQGNLRIIRITDDGVGFDVNALQEHPNGHVGLANVKTRLQSLCRATLDIQSTPGVGTAVEIIFDKEAPL